MHNRSAREPLNIRQSNDSLAPSISMYKCKRGKLGQIKISVTIIYTITEVVCQKTNHFQIMIFKIDGHMEFIHEVISDYRYIMS
jgi:hypothetical protein